MRKTHESFMQLSNGSSLLNVTNANTNYQLLSNDRVRGEFMNDPYKHRQYENVRRTSSVVKNSSPIMHQHLSPTVYEKVPLQKRRHSQQHLSSSPQIPEFVITTASSTRRSPPTFSRDSTRQSPSTFSRQNARDGKLDFSIYDHRPPYYHSELKLDEETSSSKTDYERRWSSGSTETRKAERETNSSTRYQWEAVRYQDSNHDNPYLESQKTNLVPHPPAIVTTPSSNAHRNRISVLRDDRCFSSHKNLHLLNVPGFQTPNTESQPSVSRSRSHSTPSSPELVRFQENLGIDQKQIQSPSHEDSDYSDMYRRGTTQCDPDPVPYYDQKIKPMRKHSYGMGTGTEEYRIHEGELRRIASSVTCVVPVPESTSQHRRRILPPTPDQFVSRKDHVSNRLPSQQAKSFLEMRDEKDEHTSTRITSTQVVGDQKRDTSTLPNERSLSEAQLEEHRTQIAPSSSRRARPTVRRDSMEDTSTTHCESPRSSISGRKLPETPRVRNDTQRTGVDGKTQQIGGKMPFQFSFTRQNTVGELVQSSSSSPPIGRFHVPSRRVSEQIFVQRNPNNKSARNLFSHLSPDSKSPSNDMDDAAAASAWLMTAAAISAKSQDQLSHSRSNMVVLNQLRQTSFSSSSSVPDLITTPTKNTAGIGATVQDAATDSGHGSGAESGVGDGATVSGSNSWPDAIALGTLNLANADIQHAHSGLGLLHFTIQYFPVRKRLRVSVIKAERLAGELRKDLELHTFVKLCLMPGKIQKQRGSRIVKRTRDAAFNEEFFFDNITQEDLETKNVYLRLCHHVGKQFQKDVVIGQAEAQLKEIIPQLTSKLEVKLCQELKPKQLKKLGRITISTCLENDASRLTINILKVDDLPKFGISGPPDPCVRISVDQNGKIQTKQSRILKSTRNAVFKEAVMFLVSTKREDLERTTIIVAVHDMARVGSADDVIGNVYLGQLACEKSEMDQWRNTILHVGREFKNTHQLKREPNPVDDLIHYD